MTIDPMARLGRATTAALAAAALAVTAGCGQAESSGDQPEFAGQNEAQTQPVALKKIPAGAFGRRTQAAMMKAGSYRVDMDITLNGQQSTGSGVVAVDGDQVEMDFSSTAANGKSRSRAVDGIFYLQYPGMGGKWLVADPKAKSGLGAFLGRLTAGSDPTKQLAVFERVVSVTSRGEQSVDGERTLKYHVTIPSDELVEAMKYPRELAAAMPRTLEYDIWVDSRDRIRRLTSEVTVESSSSSMEMTTSDFGVDVDVNAPPKSKQTTKLPQSLAPSA